MCGTIHRKSADLFIYFLSFSYWTFKSVSSPQFSSANLMTYHSLHTIFFISSCFPSLFLLLSHSFPEFSSLHLSQGFSLLSSVLDCSHGRNQVAVGGSRNQTAFSRVLSLSIISHPLNGFCIADGLWFQHRFSLTFHISSTKAQNCCSRGFILYLLFFPLQFCLIW